MNTELSLAMSIVTSGGRSCLSCGIISRTPCDSVQRVGGGLADHAGARSTARRSGARCCARRPRASSTRATSRSLHREAVDVLDHDLAELRRPHQVGLRGDAELALLATRCARPAPRGCCGASRPRRPAWSGGSRPACPGRARRASRTCARRRCARRPRRCTVCSRGLTMRLTRSLISSGDQRVAGEGQPDDREGVGLDLGDHRLVDRLRQAVAHARDAVAHLGGGGVGVLLEPEAHRDLALLGAADRGDDVHARRCRRSSPPAAW